ncbi:unnamed protein product [Closterium sp. NIES-53]
MSKVLIAERLGYNLLSVSQLMAKGIHLKADSTTQEFKLRTNKGASIDPIDSNNRDNSNNINISSSRDNSSSINIGSSRDNNSTSTNRQLFISTNSRHRHHTDSRPTADSRSTRRS